MAKKKKMVTTNRLIQLLADQLMVIPKANGYQSPGDKGLLPTVPLQPDQRWVNTMYQIRLAAANQHFAMGK